MSWPDMRNVSLGFSTVLITCLLFAAAFAACKNKSGNSEQEFVDKELRDLKTALAARAVGGVTTGCIVTTGSMARVSASTRDEIARLCHVEAPRMYLQLAVADARQGAAKHPGMSDITCVHLFVEGAFKTIQQHPTNDAQIQNLVDEYTRLCPTQIAKFGAGGKAAVP